MKSVRRAVQRGSVLVSGAAILGLAIACLMVLDVAHVFTVKRELQKVADLAALAGARLPGDCDAMQARAGASAGANGHGSDDGRTARFECGTWAADAGFAAGAADPTAVRATVARPVPYFFLAGGSRTVSAEAIARNEAYDVFSLGTGIADLHAGALNALLGAVAGTRIDLDLASWRGLAQSQVRLADLVAVPSLGVGTVQELLAADLRLADLALAMAQAVARDSPLSATVLETLALQLPSGLRLKLDDLVDVRLPSPEAAGRAGINVLELLKASAQLANGTNTLDLGASLPPNPLASLSLKLRVVEPPQIAIGTEGVQARSAQVRLLLDARIGSLSLPAGIASASLLHLPLYVEAAPAVATLRQMDCATHPEDCAVEIDVQGGLARACIGTEALEAPAGTAGCTGGVELLSAKVAPLGVPIADVAVHAHAVADLTDPAGRTVRFGEGGFAGSSVTDSLWTGGSAAGATVSQLLRSLLVDLALTPEVEVLGLDLGGVVGGLVNLLLRAVDSTIDATVTTVLEPVLRTVLDPLLAVLGVRVGVTDLHQLSLHCGHAELVR